MAMLFSINFMALESEFDDVMKLYIMSIRAMIHVRNLIPYIYRTYNKYNANLKFLKTRAKLKEPLNQRSLA